MSDKTLSNPYSKDSEGQRIWEEGWKHGLAQCNHHPQALTLDAVDAIEKAHSIKMGTEMMSAYGRGFTAGKAEMLRSIPATVSAHAGLGHTFRVWWDVSYVHSSEIVNGELIIHSGEGKMGEVTGDNTYMCENCDVEVELDIKEEYV